jgi:hypothetical protein
VLGLYAAPALAFYAANRAARPTGQETDMNLIQYFAEDGTRAVGAVEAGTARRVNDATSVYHLAIEAVDAGKTLAEMVADHGLGDSVAVSDLLDSGRVLPPIDHPDPAHLHVTGTGLTHLGSAATRDAMHKSSDTKTDADLTDSMKMFRMGLEGGKPSAGEKGVQPEWFYKGNGHSVIAPGHPIPSPAFARDAGEEPEIAGLYVIDRHGQPRRLGFAIANEFSDHVTERVNYLYLAHSKLRACSYGPELRLGDLPGHCEGTSRIIRDGQTLWEKPFLSGEDNMSHTIANLEYHHFKYEIFRTPGDVHVHMFGTATLSFADGISTQAGDIFEITEPQFGAPLRNPVRIADDHAVIIGKLY